MSFGYCFALFPLLSLEPESVFGEGHKVIRHVPVSELTTPEEYLQKISPHKGKAEVVEEVEPANYQEGNDLLVSSIAREEGRNCLLKWLGSFYTYS
jgi:hypothetical protein